MMMGSDLSEALWLRSSFCASQSACVEVAQLTGVVWLRSSYGGGRSAPDVDPADLPHAVAIRDSRDPDGPAIALTMEQWHRLLTASKAHLLDP